jgi:nitrite reductase (NADH) small subunit
MSSVEKKWVRVAESASFPMREGRAVEIGGRQLAIFNLGKEFVAVENRCPHRGGPLADGLLSGNTIVCPLHTWKFDLLTGVSVNHQESGACLKIFATQEIDGVVCVEVPTCVEEEETMPMACDSPDRPLRWVARKPITAANPPQPPQQ